ncbi:MAG: hypothetical protein GEU99_26490 [Luteitalea sp.]|nr:hypothetical protein [Luteitalea sp.]
MRTRASDLLKLSARDSDIGVLSVADLRASPAAFDSSHKRVLLLYGFRDCPDDRALLARISGGRALRVRSLPPSPTNLTWTSKAAQLAPELAGTELTLCPSSSSFSLFVLQSGLHDDTVETLALLGGLPWFLRVSVRDKWVYLLGIDEIPDPGVAVSSAVQELPLVSAAVALLVFVRTHFPAASWFSRESYGNFVIDDPLLRPSHGFVQHEQLASRVARANGAATIAFIPWNARRSAKETAELYKVTPQLSICAHGFEHIGEEFATPDLEDLHWRATSAMRAMRLHESLTGVGFEAVMVFPQGKFSSDALGALASAGFLAAANSTFLATDATGGVRLEHLLEPAVTAYGPLPLFRRRAPEYLSRFRYDLILGKPLLLVEHHEYFKDQGEAFEQVFETIRGVAPLIQWIPLGHIAKRLHLMRAPRAGHREVRFYCRQFRFRVPDRATYEFTKREVSSDVRAVHVNGRPVDFTLERDTLRFCEALAPNGRDVDVFVDTQPGAWTGNPRRGMSSKLSVAARRYLSEGRDNYIATNAQFRSGWSLVRRLLKP